MNLQTHNPGYKLISVTINNKEFVYGESNTGGNAGLEIYYSSHYSRRHQGSKIPGIYDLIYRRLKALVKYCPEGQKLSLDNTEYNHIAQLQIL